MGLHEGPRQVLAGGLAAAIFLGLFFGLTLVWWLALVLAGVAFGALLLVIPRKRRAEEILRGTAVTQADMEKAASALKDHTQRLDRSLPALPPSDRAAVQSMAAHLMSIHDNVLKDPEDYRSTRRFIFTYLPNMVQTIESYAGIAGQATGAQADRVAQLGAQIRAYVPVIEEIDRACIENDISALEAEVDALGTQLSRRLR